VGRWLSDSFQEVTLGEFPNLFQIKPNPYLARNTICDLPAKESYLILSLVF
jgi:hypothetical protein